MRSSCPSPNILAAAMCTCLLLVATSALAGHVTVTNDILAGDLGNIDLEMGYTLTDRRGDLIGEEVYLADGESRTWHLRRGGIYALSQASALPEGWSLTVFDPVDGGKRITCDLEDALISFKLAGGQNVLKATFVNSYPPSNVPVPAALWLFASGLLGIAGFRRKLKR